MAKGQPLSDAPKNAILSKVSPAFRDRLRPQLKSVELEVKMPIYDARKPIEFIYFIEAGMISVVSAMDDGGSIEVGTIGNEGMAGGFLLLGNAAAPYQH